MSDERDSLYQPLDKAKRQFRLMRLHYSSTDILDCRLNSFSLDEQIALPPYIALTYCWTTEPATCEICLGGRSFLTRPNLFEYLRVMREELNTRWNDRLELLNFMQGKRKISEWVFIDALCINQEDPDEQKIQIALMGDVYGNAQGVIAWLGVHREDEEYHGDLTKTVSAKLTRYGMRKVPRNWFLQGSFWSRLWIVQEVILARTLTLQFGTARMREDEAISLFRKLFEKLDSDPAIFLTELSQFRRRPSSDHAYSSKWEPRHAMSFFSILMAERQRLHKDSLTVRRMSLMKAIAITGAQQCSKAYDKIFGVLGLTGSCLKVDYTVSRLELYLRVVIECMLESNHFQEPNENEELKPMWVHFWKSLLTSLELSPWDPVVHLTTYLAIYHCSAPHLSWYGYHRSYVLSCELYNPWLGNRLGKQLFRVYSWLRFKATHWQIRWYLHNKSLVSASDNSNPKTLREWTDTLQTLFTKQIRSTITPSSNYFNGQLALGQSRAMRVTKDVYREGLDEDLSALVCWRADDAYWGFNEENQPHVIAHDIGGHTVLRAAVMHGVKYASFLLMDAVAVTPWGTGCLHSVKAHPEVFLSFSLELFRGVIREYVQSAAVKPLLEEKMQEFLHPWLHRGEAGRKAFIRQLRHAELRHTEETGNKYGAVMANKSGGEKKLKIVWAEKDTWVPLERGEDLRRRIEPAEFVVIKEAGHLIMIDQPEAVMYEIATWLARVTA